MPLDPDAETLLALIRASGRPPFETLTPEQARLAFNAGRMVTAWCLTMPSAGVTGAVMWWIGHLLGGNAGAVLMVMILVGLGALMWLRSRRAPINPENVNDEWVETPRLKTRLAG